MNWRQLPLFATSLLTSALAQHVGAPTDDLTNIGVDELFSVQVTSVGRKAQRLSKAPASIFVLTAEDIRRSGATSIPEALRWVPGVTALSLDGRSWTVSIRGFETVSEGATPAIPTRRTFLLQWAQRF